MDEQKPGIGVGGKELSQLEDNSDAMQAIRRMASATSDKTRYKYLSILELTQGRIVSGCSNDWVLRKAKVPYSYALELRGKGEFGFELPAKQIGGNGKELMAFLKTLAFQIFREFPRKRRTIKIPKRSP